MNSVVSSAVPPGLPDTTEPPCPRDESRGYSHRPLRGQQTMSGASWHEITASAVMLRQTALALYCEITVRNSAPLIRRLSF